MFEGQSQYELTSYFHACPPKNIILRLNRSWQGESLGTDLKSYPATKKRAMRLSFLLPLRLCFRFALIFRRLGEVRQRVGAALRDKVVHGNALLLGDSAQLIYEVFGQAERLADHFRPLHMKHGNPLSWYAYCTKNFPSNTHIKKAWGLYP